MLKTLKMSILLIIITLGFLFLTQTEVGAVELNSTDALNEAFKGKNAIVNGTTITLTGDVTIDDLIQFMDEDFILDLNGHTLKVDEFYVSGASLTINDATKKGIIDTVLMQIEEGGNLTVNQMILESSEVFNAGTEDEWEVQADLALMEGTEAVINNATIEHGIWNDKGTLTIKNAKVDFISQGGIATIYDGEFINLNVLDLESNKTILYGGTFINEEDGCAVIITTANEINSNTIQKIVADDYLAIYGNYSSDGSIEDQGVTYYASNWGKKVTIIKDISTEIFDKVAPNGVWNTNTLAPTNTGDSEFLLSAIADDYDLPEGYELMAYVVSGEPFDASKVELHLYYNGSYVASKTVKATYSTPDKETLNAVNKILAEIDKVQQNDFDVKTSFRLEDLYLINYLNASSKGIDESMALNFAKDLIELTNGGNVVYKLDSRLGEYNPIDLWDYKGGQVIVYYNGKAINTTMIGVTVSKVLYVPMDTADNDEARMNAAMNRIKEYLGTTKGISIEVGGTLSSLNVEDMTWNEYGLFDETTSGDNYYIVTINDKEYKFIICKKENLETPKYIASDVMSKILVTSDDTSIPLDAALTVKEVKSDTIEKSLGTSIYAAYDISLYSNAKQVNITKIESGKFVVSIPVPEILKDKKITVYYINSNGEKEEHIAKVENGIATFETDHFSTYVLAEKNILGEKDETPKTGAVDIIGYVLVVTIISALGIVVLNKKK